MKIKKTLLFTASGGSGSIGGITDMLRYDRAFINPTEFPKVVAFFDFATKQGVYKSDPTFGRWKSFGVELEPFKPQGEYSYAELAADINPAKWVTYRRGRAGGFQRVTLEQVMQAEDFPALDESIQFPKPTPTESPKSKTLIERLKELAVLYYGSSAKPSAITFGNFSEVVQLVNEHDRLLELEKTVPAMIQRLESMKRGHPTWFNASDKTAVDKAQAALDALLLMRLES